MMERDPAKRRVKPAQTLIDFDDLGESSDDSDFRIEDHCDESDLDDSMDSDDGNKQGESEAGSDDGSDESEDDELNEKMTVEDVLIQAQQRQQFSDSLVEPVKVMICCVCLGDRSDAANEIVECDGCGVTVHEGCYGVSENDSISSTVSSCSTMPWFCEACRAGVDNPTCELCPNSGGIFKETDVGKWVHLVCALYIPGVAFGEVDKLASVTLFEMAYSKWGAKSCQFCLDQRFTRTGVAIGCDAGMCRTYFHVTCGQREGLLSEAHSEEVDQADPFYAHCKLHSDKTLMRKRRRNWLALELRTAERKKQYESEGHNALPEQQRIQRKLGKYRSKYATGKITKPTPWVPTQKMGRMLTSSASACRALWRKAELSGVDTEAWALREAQAAALADVHRKWHIPPAFSVEFIGYYLDRNVRMETMRRQLSELLDENAKLREDQQCLQTSYDEINKENAEEVAINSKLKTLAQKYHDVILNVAPNKKLPSLETLGKPVNPAPTMLSVSHPRHPLASSLGGVPTAAALKAGVGFPLGLRRQEGGPLGLNNNCGICHRTTDQHLLAKCDTCHLYYHLGCLNPPLTRMPKKTKLMGWQCSECDKESSGSEVECIDPEAPRKLRNPKESNGETSVSKGPVTPTSVAAPVTFEDNEAETPMETLEEQLSSPGLYTNSIQNDVDSDHGCYQSDHSGRSNKKRRREKHHRYSPEPSGSSQIARPHKRKRKRKTQDNPEEGEHRPALKICLVDPPNPLHPNASRKPENNPSLVHTLPNRCPSNELTLPYNNPSLGRSQPNRSSSSVQSQPNRRTSPGQSKPNHRSSPVQGKPNCSSSQGKPNLHSPSDQSQSNHRSSSLQSKPNRHSLPVQNRPDKHILKTRSLPNKISDSCISKAQNLTNSSKRLLDPSLDLGWSGSRSRHEKNNDLKPCSVTNLSRLTSVQVDSAPTSGHSPPIIASTFNQSVQNNVSTLKTNPNSNSSTFGQNPLNSASSLGQNSSDNTSKFGHYLHDNVSTLSHNPMNSGSTFNQNQLSNVSSSGHNLLNNASSSGHNLLNNVSSSSHNLLNNSSSSGHNLLNNASSSGHNLLNNTSSSDHNLLNNPSTSGHNQLNNASSSGHNLLNNPSSSGHNLLNNASSSSHNLLNNASTFGHNTPENIPILSHNKPEINNQSSLSDNLSDCVPTLGQNPPDHYPSLGRCLNSLFYPSAPYSMSYPAPYSMHPEQLNHISTISHCLNSFLLGASAFPQPYPAPGPSPYNMFKSIPHPTGEGNAYVATPGGAYQASTPRPMFVTSHPSVPRVQAATPRPPVQSIPRVVTPPAATTTAQGRVSSGTSKKPKESDKPTLCDTCNTLGTNANLVRCDECMKGFHFACLDPPVKKSPKVRGYSWHCANCDPTESDSS